MQTLDHLQLLNVDRATRRRGRVREMLGTTSLRSVNEGSGPLGVAGVLLRRGPIAVGGRLRPAVRRVLPLLLAPVGQQIDQREAVAELLRATALGVVRPV